MENINFLAVGTIFLIGGAMLARDAFNEDRRNAIEAVLFGLLGVAFGVFLCWVGIFGAPDQ
jgi:uncharacterized membrane protein HdeD (DUF308 family)